MEQKFQQFLQEHHIGEKGIVLACSGGVDSMVLAHVLFTYHKGPLYLAHIHHGLRTSADKDAQCVESFAQKHSLPFFLTQENVLLRAREEGENIENMGRKVRYDFLREVQQKTNSAYIMTAHHGDDQIESMLMHLIQGTSPSGMKGLGHSSILRPLLHVNKAMILSYAQQHNISYCEDETNKDTNYFRNEMRSNVLPILYKRNARVFEAFQRFADHEAQREGVMIEALQAIFSMDIAFTGPFSHTLFMKQSLLLRQALVKEICSRYASLRSTQVTIENLTKQLEHMRSGGAIHLGEYCIERDFDLLHVRPCAQKHVDKEQIQPLNAWVDRDQAEGGIHIAAPLPHQPMYFSHNGRVFHKSFKKYCVEKKIPVQRRKEIRVLIYTKTNEIAAIEGYPPLCTGEGNYIFYKGV